MSLRDNYYICFRNLQSLLCLKLNELIYLTQIIINRIIIIFFFLIFITSEIRFF